MTEYRIEPPRISYGYARRLGAISDPQGNLAQRWKGFIEQSAKLGFTQLLSELPQLGPQDAPFTQEQVRADIVRLVSGCKRARLQLWLAVSIGELNADDNLAQSHPEWYRPALAGDVVDPRLPPSLRNKVILNRDHGRVPEMWADCWADTLEQWLDAGVTGLCFHLPQRVPAAAWRTLLARLEEKYPDAHFAAWTPGVNEDDVAALRGAGFDSTFSSLAWWDYRSGWFSDELARLARVGGVIGLPTDPFRLDEDGELPAPADRQQAIRAIWAAAAGADGWLLPMGYGQGQHFDLSADIKAANAFVAKQASDGPGELRVLTGPDAAVTALWRRGQPEQGRRAKPSAGVLVLVNADTHYPATVSLASVRARLPDGHAELQALDGTASSPSLDASSITLPPAGVALYTAHKTAPVVTIGRVTRYAQQKTLSAAMASPRLAVEAVTPSVDEGRFALKRSLGESVTVEADIFMDGHDKIAAAVMWRAADSETWTSVPMSLVVNDRWRATFTPERVGLHYFVVEAWYDTFSTYHNELSKKHAAGIDVTLELEEGRRLLVAMQAEAGRKLEAGVAAQVKALVDTIATVDDAEALQHLLAPATVQLFGKVDMRHFASRSEAEFKINVERPAAQFANWYELFPRSQSGDTQRHGNFGDVIARLPAIRDMGFDVLYFPPIHPIGRKNRKGRNNSLVAQDADPGSPYAIGADEGGHDTIHPELGTLDDFRNLVAAAADHGLEIALDFAIQCSPDHPWLREHPEWFAWRADGSIRYAENPPKKYEDIVNVDFYAPGLRGAKESASAGLWMALRDVVLFWCKEGVRTFRVDNPHTKPLPFWEWLIAEVQGRYPDALFLSEAFTKPKMMYRLAKLGFSQSYTYFTWREHKQELIAYLEEISRPPVSDHFRPNFFVNTPDINPRFLQVSGRPGFLIRAALATTMSGLWGMYNGFELCEGTPVPGKEDYLDSEKYEIRAWDYQRPGNIVAEITQLNTLRRNNPALQTHKGIRFHAADNDRVIAYTKATPERDNVVLVVINLDPYAAQGAWLELPLWEFGLPDDGALHAEDLLHGHRFTWYGKRQFVQLEPGQPYAIWRVSINT